MMQGCWNGLVSERRPVYMGIKCSVGSLTGNYNMYELHVLDMCILCLKLGV